jgi:hypothetical protein
MDIFPFLILNEDESAIGHTMANFRVARYPGANRKN